MGRRRTFYVVARDGGARRLALPRVVPVRVAAAGSAGDKSSLLIRQLVVRVSFSGAGSAYAAQKPPVVGVAGAVRRQRRSLISAAMVAGRRRPVPHRLLSVRSASSLCKRLGSLFSGRSARAGARQPSLTFSVQISRSAVRD